MKDLQFILLFIGSIYGTFALLLKHFTIVNERRDKILDPADGADLIARRNAFYSDWVPLQLGMTFAMFFMSIFLIIIYFGMEEKNILTSKVTHALLLMSFLIHLGAFISHLFGGIKDFLFIRERLTKRNFIRMIKMQCIKNQMLAGTYKSKAEIEVEAKNISN